MSSLQVDNIQTYNSNPPVIKNVSGTEVGTFCRAWVNFNGQGVVAIRSSFNVSSITDNSVGNYTVNFTNAMPDANYSACISTRTALSFVDRGDDVGVMSASGLSVGHVEGNAYADTSVFVVAIFR
jgi:hypothetical protein